MIRKLHFYAKSLVCFTLILLLVTPPLLAQQPKEKQVDDVSTKRQNLKQPPTKKLEKVDFQTCYRIWADWYQAKLQGIEKPVPALKISNASVEETNKLNSIWNKAQLQAKADTQRKLEQKKQLSSQTQNPQQSLTIDPVKNRITSPGYAYDLAGNLIAEPGATYAYDAENRLITATVNGVVTNYFYDGKGRRVGKVVDGVTTLFVYDIQGQLIAEYQGNSPLSAPSKEYVYNTNGLLAIIESDSSNNNQITKFITSDHLGTPRVIIDFQGRVVNRYDYHPFGQQISASLGGRSFISGYVANDSLRQKFTGYERDDETGLDFAQARYFSSIQGRFTSLDTLGASEVLENPQTWNRYSYVLNNPLRYRDPNGQAPQEGADIRQRQDIKDLMEGKITQQQYQDRQKARAVGAAVGLALLGARFVGVRALPVFVGLAGRNPQVIQQVTNEVVQISTGSPLPAPSNIITGNFGKASFKLTEEALEVDVKIIANKGDEGLAALTKFKMAAIDKAKELGASKVVINTGPILEESGKLVKILNKLVKKGEAVKLAQPGSPKYQITINVPK